MRKLFQFNSDYFPWYSNQLIQLLFKDRYVKFNGFIGRKSSFIGCFQTLIIVCNLMVAVLNLKLYWGICLNLSSSKQPFVLWEKLSEGGAFKKSCRSKEERGYHKILEKHTRWEGSSSIAYVHSWNSHTLIMCEAC